MNNKNICLCFVIDKQSVSPGVTHTDLFEGKQQVDEVMKVPLLQAEDVAKVIVDALSASPTCQVIELVVHSWT